ncbi:hypothetical protein SAMN02746041_00123 [Desulfacinum hydrothermale DSM 13146]|uniref:Uncharacterized protein n=1 Tax=Desulfacinum hydrothermale DSM 13146 TaxID=1121390 RepID=A0A1W1WY15_9BACT|nr:hypothetical protein [Desulfacinum hydrothermale]SMC16626.1 hypothetical protein SAMN02746041_00123 [Desulfacinum hydrothermale DSM 13146]
MTNEKKQDDLLPGLGCAPPLDSEGNPYGCAERKTVFTVKEEKVLQRILAVKEEARQVKSRLKELSSHEPGDQALRTQLETRLQELKALREELEAEREATFRERMELLGHR